MLRPALPAAIALCTLALTPACSGGEEEAPPEPVETPAPAQDVTVMEPDPEEAAADDGSMTNVFGEDTADPQVGTPAN